MSRPDFSFFLKAIRSQPSFGIKCFLDRASARGVQRGSRSLRRRAESYVQTGRASQLSGRGPRGGVGRAVTHQCTSSSGQSATINQYWIQAATAIAESRNREWDRNWTGREKERMLSYDDAVGGGNWTECLNRRIETKRQKISLGSQNFGQVQVGWLLGAPPPSPPSPAQGNRPPPTYST